MRVAGRISRMQLGAKRYMRIGTWNVTLLTGKGVEIAEEMEKYKLAILGVSETKRKGSGQINLDKRHVMRYSGVSRNVRAKEGVAIIMSEAVENKVTGWEPISSRLISVDVELEESITLVQVYAPNSDMEEVDKEQFYVHLQKTIDKSRERS
ncbi:PREDICTED: craniofacial development protein 2-like [Dinoponera quadriceps]|uniref:Craniofacial development protein 2-like n=1 Tax=Dinoponera quadriceps TaxID=609295 RepID=A0A6P3Y9B8_DINQU|nr:PREDICTED: craniofacial development protein 2-like [Dinoponera quadriceps]